MAPRQLQAQASSRLDELANAIAKVESVVVTMESSPTRSANGSYKKGIMEHKIIMQQHRLGNDRKEYRNWLEKMKNAIDQVDIDMRKTLDEIDVTHWGMMDVHSAISFSVLF